MITYRLLFLLLTPLILAHLLWKFAQAKQSRYLKQRLGFGLKTPEKQPLWFHCASVGEVNTVLPLIDDLHRRDPELNFVITSNTTTSASIIERQAKRYIRHIYLPLDWQYATRRFIRILNPGRLFIIETELWPTLIDECHRCGIEICIINGRLSSRTTRTNNWMSSIYAKTLKKIGHIYTRSDADRQNFIELGAADEQVSNVGNLKYAINAQQVRAQDLTKRDYVLLASTHDDEEKQICEQWLKLERDELLVVAPRHPERKNRILEQLLAFTDKIAVRTDNSEITDDTKIYLLDTVGELNGWFVSARLVIMGGSFVERGGHNVIEPAQQGRAIVYGPHMDNFQFEHELLSDKQAAVQVGSISELATTLTTLLDDEDSRRRLEENAAAAVRPLEAVLSGYSDIVLRHIRKEDRPDTP